MRTLPLLLFLAIGAYSRADDSTSTTPSTHIITTYRPKQTKKERENLVASETAAVHPYSRGPNLPSASPSPAKLERLRIEDNKSSASNPTRVHASDVRPKSPQSNRRDNPVESESSWRHTFAARQTDLTFRPTPLAPERQPLRSSESSSRQGDITFRPTPIAPERQSLRSQESSSRQADHLFRPTPIVPKREPLRVSEPSSRQVDLTFRPTPLVPERQSIRDSESSSRQGDITYKPTPIAPEREALRASESSSRAAEIPFRPTANVPEREALRASESSSRHAFTPRQNALQTAGPPSASKTEDDGVEGSESSRHAISRRQDVAGRRRPGASGGPPGAGGGPQKDEEPDYDDPNADRSYNFRFDTPVYSRREQADPKGEVTGRYTFVDDAGVRRVVDYLAGGRTGFYVRGSYPDPEIPGLSLFQPSYGPGGRGPARARTSVHRGVDGSYRFDYGGPEHRRRESSDANGNVRGAYTYLDSQGRTRTVQYIAGPGIGFRVTQNTLGPPGPFVYPFPRPTIVPQSPTTRPRPGGGPATLRPSASTFPANPNAVPRPPPETDFKDETLDSIPDLSSSGGGNFPQGAASPGSPLDGGSPFPSEDELPSPPLRGGDDGRPPNSDSNSGKYPGKEFDEEDPSDQSLPPAQQPPRDERPFRREEENVNSFEDDFDKTSPNDQEVVGGQREGGANFPVGDFETDNGERGGGGVGARPGPFRGRIIGGRSVGDGPYGRKRVKVKGRRGNNRPIRKDGPPRDYRREENAIPDVPSSGDGGIAPRLALVQSIDLGPAGSGAPQPSIALETGTTYTSRRSAPPLRVPVARRWAASSRDTPS